MDHLFTVQMFTFLALIQTVYVVMQTGPLINYLYSTVTQTYIFGIREKRTCLPFSNLHI